MFKNKKEVFSIRKFKDGRSDSVKIGAIALLVGTSLAVSGNIVQAKEITNRMDDSSLVSDTSNVDSSKSTTFVDSTNTDKKVTVDAVLDGGVAEPTKANNNNGEKDGTDSLNIKSETNVNYYLEEDNSKLKDTTKVETGTGTISTDYDKKGIASDVDGKDYRESTVNKDGITVSEETGKEDVIKANGKAYKLKRSEVVDKDKVKYDKTNFNDIEAKVSPEGLHTSVGEIDYTKLSKKKVYLVEETSDGHYGKFVEVSGVTSDEDAVAKWKAGEATAKEFTKENVTLEEGDSILVLDKDTYATTRTVEKKSRRTGNGYTYEAISEVLDNSNSDVTAFTYAINRDSYDTIKSIGEDGIFGTADDSVINLGDDTREMTSIDLSSREDKYSNVLPKIPALNYSTASSKDIIKDIYGSSYSLINYLLSKAETESDREKINSAKSRIDEKVNEIVTFMNENKISIGLKDNQAIFYVSDTDRSKDNGRLNSFEEKIRSIDNTLETIPTITKTLESGVATRKDKEPGGGLYNMGTAYLEEEPISKTVKEVYGYNEGLISKVTTEFHREGGTHIEWESWDTNENNTNLSSLLPKDWKIKVSDDKSNVVLTKEENSTGWNEENHNEYTSTIVKKEIISPIRAYNVVSDGTATVNHYYDLKLEPEALKETIETKGKAIVKYVDADGNEIKSDETLVPETVIKTVKKYETKSDVTVISTREEVENNETAYNATTVKEDIIEKDGKRYKLNKVLETSDKYNNTASETGNLTEGTTTIVYQYDYLVPVDPTKPHEGQTNPPSPDDKIPNDPLNRSYKDLGLLKEVKRDITYVYENGPKAGQEASAPVNQKAGFTRTAEINSRTGEVTYRTEWTPGQNLNEVVSPVKDKYAVDKEKVETLAVTHESEDSSVVVKYTENPEVIDHDEAKDKKGTVIVKLIDDKGELLKEETIKNNVTVATATTKVYADRDPETTYTPTNEEYSTVDKKVPVFEKDGKKYKLNKLVEVSPELNNSIDETGKVKEGTTTVIYQYDLIVPADPTKPHEGETKPPQPEDKVPNDPQNRSYKDLGLAKEVIRNITYVYENGPKAGQEASTSVNQKARFTRTAEINSRTGEVTYTSDWTEGKNLEEVNSPKVEGYFADKEKVDTLAVTHESENSEVIVKYKESVTVIEHDVDKDKKGTVIVKLVDINGTVLKETTVKNNVTVATATTKVYADRDPETTYTPTNEEYSIERENTITIDGLTFKLNRLIPVSNELNNSIDESGKVKEGTTTIIYEYKLIIPSNDIVVEKPEFNGGVNPIEPPVVEVPEYTEPIGTTPGDAPVHELPEFNGGVNPIDPPVVEIPEYNGGVVPLDPPVVEIPEFNGGVTPIEPPIVEVPEYNGDLTPPKPPVIETPKEEPAKSTENKPVEPKQEKVLPNTNSTSVLASLVSSVIGALGLGYKSKRKK